jgi:hypothetical protein
LFYPHLLIKESLAHPVVQIVNFVLIRGKSKAVPLHAIEAVGGRGGIAPTH